MLTGTLVSRQGAYILQLPEAMCFQGTGVPDDFADSVSYAGQTAIHLSASVDLTKLSKNMGNAIEVTGRPYARHTAWHMTDVLYSVDRFRVLNNVAGVADPNDLSSPGPGDKPQENPWAEADEAAVKAAADARLKAQNAGQTVSGAWIVGSRNERPNAFLPTPTRTMVAGLRLRCVAGELSLAIDFRSGKHAQAVSIVYQGEKVDLQVSADGSVQKGALSALVKMYGAALGKAGGQDGVTPIRFAVDEAPRDAESDVLFHDITGFKAVVARLAPACRDTTRASAPLPAAQAQGEGAIGDARDAVARFIEETLFRPGHRRGAELRAAYADTVDYFGKTQPIREVLADKDRYFKVWPERTFDLDRNSLRVSRQGQNLSVEFNFTYRVTGAKGARSGSGVASLVLREGPGEGFVILSENSKTVR